MPIIRPFVTAGVALVGASVIAVTPIASMQPEIRSASMNVSLVAATSATTPLDCATSSSLLCGASESPQASSPFVANAVAAPSLLNIPANLFIALANVPYNFINALGQGNVNLGDNPNSGFDFQNSNNGIDLNQTDVVGLTADLEYGGSWWVYHPFNVLGTDSADIARYQGIVNTLLPFPALSVGLGNILATTLASQLPMNVGCTGTNVGGCDHPEQILSNMFDLRHVVDLFSPGGYTFPAVLNPITCSSDGLCDIKDANGVPEPWSGQNYALNIFDPFENFYNSLTATPDFSTIKLPTLKMIGNTFIGLIRGLNTAFNPFVIGTQCGLCSPFVKIPPGTTRPGPINPGTQIRGIPGSETVTSLLAAKDAKDATPETSTKLETAIEGNTSPLKDALSTPKPAAVKNPVSVAVTSMKDKFEAAASKRAAATETKRAAASEARAERKSAAEAKRTAASEARADRKAARDAKSGSDSDSGTSKTSKGASSDSDD